MGRTDKDFIPKKNNYILIAFDVFLEKGYEQTKISDLLKAFDITKGGMYHYFSSKEDVLDCVIEYSLNQGVEQMSTTLEALPVEDRLSYLLFKSPSNEVINKLQKLDNNNKNTIVTYKVREQNQKLALPLMKRVIHQGIGAGCFSCPYPDEIAELCINMALSVSDGIISNYTAKMADALIWTLQIWLSPTEGIMTDIQRKLYSIIPKDNL